MAKIKFYLDKRKKNSLGNFPLKLSVSHNGERQYVLLEIFLKENQWDADQEIVTNKHRQHRRLNTKLTEIFERCEVIINELQISKPAAEITAQLIKDEINKQLFGKEIKAKRATFVATLEKFASFKKEGTRNLYLQTLARLRAFDKKIDDYNFEDITREWLLEFNSFMTGTSQSQNYRNIHLRNIRAIFNYAIQEDITRHYPFKHIKIKAIKTAKRSLPIDKLRELLNYPVEEYAKEYLDMFKLMIFLCGINPADLFNLKETIDGRIVYNRAKTSRLYNIKIEPEALEILDRWKGENFLLRIGDRYQDYKNYIHRMNNALKKIGPFERKGRGGKKEFQPICAELSCYWARHTWATIAAELDIPDETISLALGHGPENPTTDIYIRRNLKKIDNANRKVIDYILYGIGKHDLDEKEALNGLLINFPKYSLN